jgi:hypothetical protein
MRQVRHYELYTCHFYKKDSHGGVAESRMDCREADNLPEMQTRSKETFNFVISKSSVELGQSFFACRAWHER